MLRHHRELLLNWLRAKKVISSGVMQGLNSRLKKLAAWKGRGRVEKRRHSAQRAWNIQLWIVILAVIVPLIVMAVVIVQKKPPPRSTQAKSHYASFPGVDLTALTDRQKNKMIEVMNKESCPCSCHLTIGQCRNDDRTCKTSIKIANLLLEKIKLE